MNPADRPHMPGPSRGPPSLLPIAFLLYSKCEIAVCPLWHRSGRLPAPQRRVALRAGRQRSASRGRSRRVVGDRSRRIGPRRLRGSRSANGRRCSYRSSPCSSRYRRAIRLPTTSRLRSGSPRRFSRSSRSHVPPSDSGLFSVTGTEASGGRRDRPPLVPLPLRRARVRARARSAALAPDPPAPPWPPPASRSRPCFSRGRTSAPNRRPSGGLLRLHLLAGPLLGARVRHLLLDPQPRRLRPGSLIGLVARIQTGR